MHITFTNLGDLNLLTILEVNSFSYKSSGNLIEFNMQTINKFTTIVIEVISCLSYKQDTKL